MKKILLSMSIIGFISLSSVAQTYVSGNVSGRWTLAGSPYVTIAHDTIPAGDTLIIDPGVIVKFALGVNMYVNGTLTAVGNVTDSIRFTTAEPSPAPGQWGGINFSNDLNRPLSLFQYVILEYGGEVSNCPVLTSFRNTHLDHVLIDYNSTGIVLNAIVETEVALSNSIIRNNDNYGLLGRTLTVSNVQFISNTGYYAGIVGSRTLFDHCHFTQNSPMAYLLFDSNTITGFQNCTIENNGAGIGSCYIDDSLYVDSCIIRANNGAGINGNALYNRGTLLVSHSLIYNNLGDGITNADHGSVIERNTIDGNAGGITNIGSNSTMILRNNIISNNTGAGFQTTISPAPQLRFNDVYNNTPEFSGFSSFFGDTTLSTNHNGVHCDLYKNIIRDPLFVNRSLGDFHLQSSSPCIDAGDTALTDPDASISDIGAFYYQQPLSVYENSFKDFFTIYPNPTPSAITLESSSGNLIERVIVSGIDGSVIKSIVIPHSEKVTIDLKELSTGIYFFDCIGEKQSQKIKVVKY